MSQTSTSIPVGDHWRTEFRADDASLRLCVKSLMKLITARGWTGDEATISAALPLRVGHFSGRDLVAALYHLQLPVRTAEIDEVDLEMMELPCLLLRLDGAFGLVTGYDRIKGLELTHPTSEMRTWIGTDPNQGSLIFIGDAAQDDLVKGPQSTLETLSGLLPQLWPLFFASLLIGLLGMTTPFLVMTVYNTAIPARSVDFLLALTAALGLAYGAELSIRRVRSAAIVHVSAGLENRLGLQLLHKLVKLPVATSSRSDALQQHARLRQFESMRDAMMGPLVQAILDIPFLLLFAFALFVVSPSIGWVTLAFVGVHALGFAVIGVFQKRHELVATNTQTEMRKLVMQSVVGQNTIRRSRSEDVWETRLVSVTNAACNAQANLKTFTQNARTLLQALLTIAGLSAGFMAASQVMEDTLSLGALIAILILVWRIMVPVQALSLAADQALSIWRATKTIDIVLKIPEEKHRGISPKMAKAISGTVQFEQVSFRFPEAHSPALAGVGFSANYGEIVVLCGGILSGKTTTVELLAGLHDPLGGRILIGGEDIQQIPRDDLRAGMSVCLQEPHFLYGTIRQNLELAQPLATVDECWAALDRAGIATWIAQMPDHIETLLSTDVTAALPLSLKRGISLAMALIRQSKIYVLDQPTAGLDPDHAHHVRATIDKLKGHGTVIMTAQDQRDLTVGDRFIVLERGRVISNATGKRGRDRAIALMAPKDVEKVG